MPSVEVVAKPLCPICKAPLALENKVLQSKGQRYTFHYRCKKDGDMLLVLKLHRNFNETWRAKRTIQHASEDQLKEFKAGLERSNMRRKTRQRKGRTPRRVRNGNAEQ